MSVLAECPICHRKQSTRNKICPCGQDMDKAKRSGRTRYWIKYRLPGGKQRKESVGFSIEEARDADAARRTQRRENKLEDMLDIQADGKLSFDQLTKWYLSIEKTRCATEGVKNYQRKVRCLNKFNDMLGSWIVRNITPADLESYRLHRKNQGVSKRTIDYDLSEVKRMIKVAFFNNRVSGKTLKIFEMTKKLLKAGENTRTRVLEIEEYTALSPHLSRHARPLIDLALFTGMRPGELIPINKHAGNEATRGLTWDRVDFKNRVIILEPEDTKTKEDRRIPITDEIYEILRKIPRDLRSNHVFNHAGKPFSDFRLALKKACEKAGIPFGTKVKGGFVFRDLRTTADTFMVRAGVPDVYRRAFLGHKQQGMDRHYVHPDFEKDLREAMVRYTGWLREQVESGPQSVPQVPYSQ